MANDDKFVHGGLNQYFDGQIVSASSATSLAALGGNSYTPKELVDNAESLLPTNQGSDTQNKKDRNATVFIAKRLKEVSATVDTLVTPANINQKLMAAASGNVLMFDPEASSLVSGGAALVTRVRDFSSNLNDATAAGAARPTITSINGRSAISLTGDPVTLSLGAEITNAQSIFMVYQWKSGTANPYAPFLGSNATYFNLIGGLTPPNSLDSVSSSLQVRPQLNGAGGAYGGIWRFNGQFIQDITATAKPVNVSVVTIIPGLPGSPQDTPIRFQNIANDRGAANRFDRSFRGKMVVFSSRTTFAQTLAIEKLLYDYYSIERGSLKSVILGSGNSIMAGSTLPAGQDPLTQASLLISNASSYDIWNVAQGSQRTWQMRFGDPQSSYFGDPINLDPRTDPARPKNIIFGLEIGNELLDNVSQEQAFLNYVSWYNERVAATGGTVFACTVFSRNPAVQPWAPIDYVNNRIRQYFPANHICDFERDIVPMSGEFGYLNATYFQGDGIHPTLAGNQLMGALMATKIDSV